MLIHCPRCGLAVPGVDINIATQTAVCRPCGEVIAIPVAPAVPALAPVAPVVPSVAHHKPTDLRWTEGGALDADAWAVAIPMKRLAAIPIAFFALFWDGFLVFWYSNAIHALASGKGGGAALVMLLFPLLHLAAGVFITYQALCGLLNTTYVRFDGRSFRFERSPIPMRGSVSEPTEGISGFEPLEKSTRSRSGTSSSWDVNLLTADGRAVRVRFGFSDYGHAAYAAARLAERLVEVRRDRMPYRGLG
jgi:hypothetical protein